MTSISYHPLGPVSPGSQRAVLGLKVISPGRAEPVVLVWVPPQVTQDVDLLLRIKRETSRAMVLEHPNIVRVHGLYTIDQATARVVDFVDGEPLRKVLEAFGGKLPLALAARVVADACLGVNFAHEAGYDDGTPLLHGDIRPETVMVSFSGVSKVSGYGALVVAPRDAENQRKLHVAPEQVLGGREAISRPTDVYLLGLLLHECLTGRVPFEGNKDFERSVLSDPLPFFSPSEIPPEVATLLEKALSKRGAARFENPMALREALERAIPGIASHEAFARELAARFPPGSQERMGRKHELAEGLTALAAKNWKQPKAATVSLVDAPPSASGSYPMVAAMEAPEVERSSARGWTIALAVFMAMVAGGGLTVWRGPPSFLSSALPGIFPPDAPVFEVADAGVGLAAVEVLDAGATENAAVAGAGTAVLPDGGVGVAAGPAPVEGAGTAAVAPSGEAVGAPAGVAAAPGAAVPGVPGVPGVAGNPGAPGAPAGTGPGSAVIAAEHPGLDVATDPVMDLKFDGIPIGRGRAVVNTDSGRHVLTLTEPHTQLSVARVVYIPENGKSRLRLSIGRAFVTINAPEGAMIYLDDKKIGFAPMRGMIPVLDGSHTMSVRVGQSKWQEAFSLRPGQKVHFDVSLD